MLSLARRTASASSVNPITAAIGPKTSSRATRASGLTGASTVGANQNPGPSGALPRIATGGPSSRNEPTVLAKTNRDMKVFREEIFGPVVCIQSFEDDDLDAVAKFANDTEYGLQASIWTKNLSVAHKMARKIKAGTICINTHNYGDPAWPFGGYKQSGWGREMGKEVMEHYTETKSVAARL